MKQKKPEFHPIATSMPHTYKCSMCGKPDNLGYYNSSCDLLDMMRERKLCYQCAFWTTLLGNLPEHYEVIGRRMYIVTPIPESPDTYEGGGVQGADSFIYKPDRTFYRSLHTCEVGKIPEAFDKHFPDTAMFCTAMTYSRLIRNDFICRGKGCWDRYHCLRYDMACEKDGPFNIIPDYYKVGMEECPSFINKNTLFK